MNHYETLEIETTATADEVRRAYYRQVRKNPPEKAPEQFKRIREAYETLHDPQARRRYDTMLKHGGQLAELEQQGVKHMEDGEYEQAISRFKRVIILAPETDTAYNLMGICYCRLEKFDDAVKVYQRLLNQAPDVALYWANFGQTYYQEAEALDRENYRRGGLYKQARDAYRKAIELDRANPEYYIFMARTHTAERRFDEAEKWCERAAAAPGGRPDFDSLFYLCEVYLFSGDLDKIEKTAQRIRSATPDEEDAREYAAGRFADFGIELHKAKLYSQAASFYQAARQFDPTNPHLRELAGMADSVSGALEEYDQVKEDTSLAEGIRRLVAYYLADAYGETFEDKDAVFSSITEHIFSHPTSLILSSIQRLRSRYPNSYQLNNDAFDKIEEIARKHPTPAPTSSGGGGESGGGCFVVTATFGTPAAAEVERFRRFRDEYLTRLAPGRWFIRWYYKVGPALADWIRPRPRLRRALAWVLGGLARLLPGGRW